MSLGLMKDPCTTNEGSRDRQRILDVLVAQGRVVVPQPCNCCWLNGLSHRRRQTAPSGRTGTSQGRASAPREHRCLRSETNKER
jgi:hypothetical protein